VTDQLPPPEQLPLPEQPSQPIQPEQPIRPEQPEQPLPAAKTPRTSVRRRVALGALGVAFVLSAVGVGTGAGLALRSSAPAKPAVAAQTPKPSFGAHSDGDHYGSLSDLLLPMPAGYDYGPDDMGLGDNSVLTRDQYEAMFAKQFSFLSADQRNQLKNRLDLDHILGYGLRVYTDNGSQVLEISLLQENQHSAKGSAQAGKYLADSTDIFRAGPSIPGHPEAHCYLLPALPGDRLDSMHCDAAVGDLLVSLDGYGAAPLDQQGAAALLEAQLNRLAIPGAQI
jgi:hypothetical protein